MKKNLISIFLVPISILMVSACVHAQIPLKEAFKNDFLIGAALNESQFTGENAREAALVKEQFNSISPENVLKWEPIHPETNRYNFGPADGYVEFGLRNHMFIIGHNLIWHNQTPKWVFQDDRGNPVDRNTLLKRMHDHIFTVVGRYRGKIGGWDVVNEALDDDGATSIERRLASAYLEQGDSLRAFDLVHRKLAVRENLSLWA